jgi:hypothetical protein
MIVQIISLSAKTAREVKIMDNPCYDKKTSTDCKDRCAGCASNCKKWKEYVAERDKNYTEKNKHSEIDTYIYLRNKRIKSKYHQGVFRRQK